jgi:copper chaperone CopZ
LIGMERITFNINGMACGGCASTVQQALLALDGVVSADVSHADACAVVQCDPVKVTPELIRVAVKAAGCIAL